MLARISLALLLLLVAVVVHAAAPKVINYQGRITDASGVPVADGPQTLNFRIYSTPTGGAALWGETGVVVSTEKGVFTTSLGSPTPFPAAGSHAEEGIFALNSELWLETDVNGSTQVPRSRLQSVPYAVVSSDLAGRSATNPGIGIESYSSTAWINTYGNDGDDKVRLWGNNFGEVVLFDAGPTLGSTTSMAAKLSAGINAGGSLDLNDGSGNPAITLSAALPGDFSAQLLPDAINSSEILNEPGIAVGQATGGAVLLPASVSSSYDVVSVTISIPSPGYIVLDASLYYAAEANGDGYCFGWGQISEIPGQGQVSGYYQWIGTDAYGNASVQNNMWASSYLTRSYYSSTAGTFTYYLQAAEYNANDPSAQVWIGNPSTLRATYYPTSYGTVQQIAAKPPTENPEFATSVITDNLTNKTTTVYTEDLRYYELEAAKAYARNLEAQAALAKARSAAGPQAGSRPSGAITAPDNNK